MNPSVLNNYDVTLCVDEEQTIPGLFCGDAMRAALPPAFADSLCSDLMLAGFTYKRVDLCVGLDGADEQTYTILKKLKSATFISDRVRQMPLAAIVDGVRAGLIMIKDGYIIDAGDAPQRALHTVVLPDSPNLFGLKLRAGSRFRFFIKTIVSDFPTTLEVGGCRFRVEGVRPVTFAHTDVYVLQHDLPVAEHWRMAPQSATRFKVGYHPETSTICLRAGSVIHREDYFGSAIDV